MKNLMRFLTLVLSATISTTSAFGDCDPNGAPFGGGAGTLGDPYQICSATQLNAIGDNYALSNFRLESDIDLTGVTWNVIGFSSFYAGDFDGNGHTVSNLSITDLSTTFNPSAYPIGMFGRLTGGAVHDILLTNAQVEGVVGASVKSQVALLVGSSGSGANISNAKVTGTLKASGIIGLLVGNAGPNVTISNSYAVGSVTQIAETTEATATGGLVGNLYTSSTLINCAADVAVSGTYYLGGLVGKSTSATIQRSHVRGSVTGVGTEEEYAGGLIGSCHGCTLQDTFSSALVTGTGNFERGGLAGQAFLGANSEAATLTRVLATGTVKGKFGKGLVGIVSSAPTLTAGFWDKESTGKSLSAAGTGLKTAAATSRQTYVDAGFDMDTVWDIVDTIDYPTLRTAAQLPDPSVVKAPRPYIKPKKGKATVNFYGQFLSGARYVLVLKDSSNKQKSYKFKEGARKLTAKGLRAVQYKAYIKITNAPVTVTKSDTVTFKGK